MIQGVLLSQDFWYMAERTTLGPSNDLSVCVVSGWANSSPLNKDKWTFSTIHPDTSKNGATFAMRASQEHGNKFVFV